MNTREKKTKSAALYLYISVIENCDEVNTNNHLDMLDYLDFLN
jgi:hypothetical protein